MLSRRAGREAVASSHMAIFENANYDFIHWRWHAIALSALIILAGVGVRRPRSGLPLGIDFSGGTIVVVQVRAAGHRGRGAHGARRRVPGEKVVQSYGDPADNADPDPPAAAGRRRRAPASSRTRARSSTRCTKANLGKFEVHQPGDRRPGDRRATCSARASTPRWRRSSASPSTSASASGSPSRIGAIAATLARRARHAGVPGLLRLRPVAERRGGDPDHHRLLGERHHRHLRPRAREPAHHAARLARDRSSTRASTRR